MPAGGARRRIRLFLNGPSFPALGCYGPIAARKVSYPIELLRVANLRYQEALDFRAALSGGRGGAGCSVGGEGRYGGPGPDRLP